MNFTGQGLSSNSLLGTTEITADINQGKSLGVSLDSPKLLNQKDFSGVLGREWSEQQASMAVQPEVVLSSALSSSESLFSSDTGSVVAEFIDENGKPLPLPTELGSDFSEGLITDIDTVTLPESVSEVADLDLAVSDNFQQDGVKLSLDTVNNVADTEADLVAVVAEMNTAVDNMTVIENDESSVLINIPPLTLNDSDKTVGKADLEIRAAVKQGESVTKRVLPSINTNINASVDNTAGIVVNSTGLIQQGEPVVNSTVSEITISELFKQAGIAEQLVGSGTKEVFEKALSQSSTSSLSFESSVASSASDGAVINPLRAGSSQAYQQASPSSTVQTAVPVEVGKPGWSEGVMQRVMWMSSQNITKAEITLDPPELGSLQVRISSQGDQTSVVFTSAHATVREALDQGLPRLREMMEGQGLDLADVDVSDQHAQQQRSESEGAQGDGISDSAGDLVAEEADMKVAESIVMSTSSLVDQYV